MQTDKPISLRLNGASRNAERKKTTSTQGKKKFCEEHVNASPAALLRLRASLKQREVKTNGQFGRLCSGSSSMSN